MGGLAVTFGTAKRGLSGDAAPRPLLAVRNVTIHPSTASVPTSLQLPLESIGLIRSVTWSLQQLSFLSHITSNAWCSENVTRKESWKKLFQPVLTLLTSEYSKTSAPMSRANMHVGLLGFMYPVIVWLTISILSKWRLNVLSLYITDLPQNGVQ